MAMPGRSYQSSSSYRYGMNGQEKDLEIYEGAMTAEFWEYDSRLGRRWNTDPVVKPWESSYACFANNPIWFSDINGDDAGTTDLLNRSGDKASLSRENGGTVNVGMNHCGNDKNDLDEVQVTAHRTFWDKSKYFFKNVTKNITSSINNAAVKTDIFFNNLTGNLIIWGTATSSSIKESLKKSLVNVKKLISFDAGELTDFLSKYSTTSLGGDGEEGRNKAKETASEENVEGLQGAVNDLNKKELKTAIKKADADTVIRSQWQRLKDPNIVDTLDQTFDKKDYKEKGDKAKEKKRVWR